MEPTIYKPSIYNGAGIYKAGAEGGGDPPIPEEYKKLLFIKCTTNSGTPEISGGGMVINYNDKINLHCYFDSTINGQNYMYFFYTWEFKQRSLKFEGSGQRVFHRWNATTSNEQATNFTSGDLVIEAGANLNKINGVEYVNNTGTYDADKTLGRIFHFALPQNCMAFSFKVLDNADNLKYNLVPVKRVADSVLGFYDTINKNFIAAISGWTIPGPEVS